MMLKKRYYNRTIKVLSIGNSYSQDAQSYLYGIGRADMISLKTVNLYIGGCDLARHYRNMISDEAAYSFEINGICNTGVRISIREALISDDWDIITVQQQSLKSCDIETFEPYLNALVSYIKLYSPASRILLMRTWGYRPDSERMAKAGYSSNREMFEAVKKSYDKAYELIDARSIVPLGDAVALAVERGAQNLFRDEIHMSLGFGRYLLGLVFYKHITGRPLKDNPFCDFDKDVTDEEIALAKEIAEEVCKN